MTSVLVNGSSNNKFFMGCGTRHADPLSPFLFFIEVEGFNSLFSMVIGLEKLCGFQVGNDGCFRGTHFQFSIDTLIIGKKKKKWCNICTIKGIILHFKLLSGLEVKFHKSMLINIDVDSVC